MFKFETTNMPMEFQSPLTTENIAQIERHTKYDAGKEEAHFDDISTNYDAIQQVVGYPDPTLISEMARKIAAEKMIARSEAELVDFGCGTGLVGEALINAGFEKITGIDCSKGMLSKADEKDVYTSLEHLKLGGEEYIENFPQ